MKQRRKKTKNHDTIAAISTAAIPSAIGIIRISGKKTSKICSQILYKNQKPLTEEYFYKNPRYVTYCDLVISNKMLDQVLFTFFKAPHSFTGEDMGEISMHGNPILMRKVLESLFTLGARPAERGEFTKRAYLNGKLDISSAEAISRLINARSKFELELAQKNLFGELWKLESRLRSELMNIKAECEAEIDFSTEDLTFESLEERKNRFKNVIELCQKIISGSQRAEQMIQKTKIVIYGEPNVGKSSLMNLILGKERAIVSHIPGTTRDFLTEDLYLEGLPIQLVDTAGIRETEDLVEKLGIQRSEKEFESANVRILVVDLSQNSNVDKFFERYATKLQNTIVLGNKCDILHPTWNLNEFSQRLTEMGAYFVKCSCKSKEGVDELLEKIHELISSSEIHEDVVLLEERNIYLLKKIISNLETALTLINENAPSEIYVKEVDSCLELVGQINGRIDTEEILGRIFSKFCIGK
ncbi:MAG: tRNA uridine-5-carboxymethylaminomethyl(34) synthesis GTPase MnmE [Leptospiraceae bacterium]|nr:tRNA uridine-5-carboxymethylaminomethyl(34) synthesis GTPase MnmE [Leptospiraceae bacterium]